MKNIPPNYLVFFGSIIVAIMIIVVFVEFATTDMPTEPVMLYVLSDYKGTSVKGPINMDDIEVNSSRFFYYPEPQNNKDRDVQEQFLLIRLPSPLGGNNDDASAFRAYSALDPSSSCLVKYWPEPDRQRIEDPCRSPPYRVIDGISEYYSSGTFFGKPTTGALAKLDLMIDDSGLIHVMPPTFTADKNGIIGSGRNVTPQEFQEGTELLQRIQDEYDKKMSEFYLPPVFPSGHVLYDIFKKDQYKWRANYLNPENRSDWNSITFEFCDCNKTLEEFVREQWTQTSNFWMINDSFIYAQPNKVDFGNGATSHYTFIFYADKYRIEIRATMSLEDGMTLVLENYFPENTLDDLTNMQKG